MSLGTMPDYGAQVEGVALAGVRPGSPADKAGIRGGNLSIVVQGEEYLLGGDILTAIAGTPIRTHADYVGKVKALRPGQRVRLTIVRDGQAREITLTVAERLLLRRAVGRQRGSEM